MRTGSGSRLGRPAALAGTLSIGDLTVNRLGFGAMRITGQGIWGDPPDRAEAKRVVRRAVELGVNFIDTADSYGPEVSELLVAEVLFPYPDGLVIGTKGGSLRPGPGAWLRDCRPEHLKKACEHSLRRLKLEQIPLYQLHAVDADVPIEESIGALEDLRREGKIRHIGVSNVDESHLRRAQAVAPIVSVQNRYSLVDRRWDELVDLCEREGLAFLPWAPVNRGWPVAELRHLAMERGVNEQQLMLAWLLARSPAMLPIPGTGSLRHLEEDVAAAGMRLSDEDLRHLARAA